MIARAQKDENDEEEEEDLEVDGHVEAATKTSRRRTCKGPPEQSS